MTTIEPRSETAARVDPPGGSRPLWPAVSTPSPKAGWLLPLVNAVAWVGLVSLVFAVAPPPDPNAPVDVLSLVLSEIFWLAALGALVGLVSRSEWAYGLTVVGGVTLAAGAVVCFAGGHTGAWIAVQFLAGVGLGAVGAASLGVTR